MFYSVICESNLLQHKHLGVYPINRIDRWGLSASDSVEANNTGDLLLGAAVIAIAIPEPITTVAGLIYAGIAVGATGAIIYEAVTGDSAENDRSEEASTSNGGSSPDPDDNRNLTDREGKIASETGNSVEEVKDAIHKVKRRLPRNGSRTNPNVQVDLNTGEVYPEVDGKSTGDSIGNIYDYLPQE